VNTQSQNKDPTDCHQPPKMMVGAFVSLKENAAPVDEVRRGMAIFTSDGVEAGKAAAVVIDEINQTVTHIVLCRLGQPPEYRLTPLSLIERVDEEGIWLCIPSHDVVSLAKRQREI